MRTDGSNAFARHTMRVRLPRIVRDVGERRADCPPGVRSDLERLATDLETDAAIPAPSTPAPDIEAWEAAHAEHAGETWLGAEWFYAELAAYREIAARARFWETGKDPFLPGKEEEVTSERLRERLSAALEAGGSRENRIASRLEACLWANRVDLSHAGAASLEASGDLLVDDCAAAVAQLTRRGAMVHVVADNAGTELAMDLALIDALLEDRETQVAIHLKMQPVFVSDAMPSDLWRVVETMHTRVATRPLAERILEAFDGRRIRLLPDLLERSAASAASPRPAREDAGSRCRPARQG